MPRNVEIKAKVNDPEAMMARAAALAEGLRETLVQEDTFFYVKTGRLKLRVLSPGRGELIYYARTDSSGPKASRYDLVETSDPEGLRRVLAIALGVRGVVKKKRLLYRVGQTRIHLDDVKGLGTFLELEVEMRPGERREDGDVVARDLMARLGIEERDLVSGAYIDLVEQRGA
jgi:predicted adenylyl cyclase CyaB